MEGRAEQEERSRRIVTLQRLIRSYAREQLHFSIFKKQPATDQVVPDLFNKKHPRLNNILRRLAAKQTVVGNTVFHWTTLQNFESILQSKAIYGSRYLKASKIIYEPNALSPVDIANGDGNVICLCPHFIDRTALIRNGRLRDGLMRLTINVDKIRKPLPGEQYNQFFKLFDFMSPEFDYLVIINDQLSVEFKKTSDRNVGIEVVFTFNEKDYRTYLNNQDAIFYGHLAAINQFCLWKVCELAEKAFTSTSPFDNRFFSYLGSLPDDEITKIFIIVAQGLTIFSEYNFNAVLPLTDGLITELYYAKDKKRFVLNDDSSMVDGEFFQSISKKTGTAAIPFEVMKDAIVTNKELYGVYDLLTEKDSDNEDTPMIYNFSSVPAALFDSNDYIETRIGRVSETVKKKPRVYFGMR